MSKSEIDLSAAPSASFQATTLDEAYQEEPYLRPENIGETLLERLPSPTGWRILILPYRGVGKTSGGIALPKEAVEQQHVSTQVGYVLKVGDLAYKDPEKLPVMPDHGFLLTVERYGF